MPQESFIGLVGILVFAGAVFLFFAMRAKRSGETDPRKKLVRHIRFTLWAAGGSLIYLLFLLPSTPSLSTFGYPQTTADVGDPQKVLHYLQWYNREIVRTAEVVHWAIFIGVFFIGASIEGALRAFSAIPPETPHPPTEHQPEKA